MAGVGYEHGVCYRIYDYRAVHENHKPWGCENCVGSKMVCFVYCFLYGQIKITVTRWEIYTKIDIADTGKGIPEKSYGAIFKRFYRELDVHNQEGIGVGLYLSRKIISMQGGYIEVKSMPGEGSVFSVFIPN